MRRIYLLSIGLALCGLCHGRYITFLNSGHQPVPDVRCTGYSEGNDSIASWTSDANGTVDTGLTEFDHLTASHPEYSDRLVFSKELTDGHSTVTLSPAVELGEVVVTPSDVEEFDTHTSYRLSGKDMARYTNVLQSLNVIPNLTVLSNGAVFFEGNENVKILVDGVDATTREIQTLSKEDIAKVDVYQTPPLRFISQGVSAVVDIRLKSKIHGGNGAVDIMQAFQSLKGSNTAAFYYNYRQSRFSLLYSNENRHYRKQRTSEVLDYEFDGVRYRKVKDGLDSKSHLDDNGMTLTYQINRPQDFLYNVKAGFDINRNGGTAMQDVHAGDQSFLATNRLRTDYDRFNVGNYFEKSLGRSAGTFLANVNYQHYSTTYNSAYDEHSDSETAVNDSRSDYRTRLDAVFSEIQYQSPFTKAGMFMADIFGSYKHSRYVDTDSPFHQTSSVLGGAVQWLGRKGKLSWYLSCGATWLHTASTSLDKAHDLCIPTPVVTVNWRPSQKVRLGLGYSYEGTAPSIAELSETDQWLDTRLVYHGNSTLKPYRTHAAYLRLVFNNRYTALSARGFLSSSPGMICDMYTLTDEYMLQTLVNLSRYRELGAQLDISVYPLGSDRLVFWNRVIYSNLRGRNSEYSWNGYRFQWMSTLSLNIEHWTFELYYQYPGKIVQGQLERPRAQCWSVSASYRPGTNLSVGLSLFMPFGKGFSDSEHTVNSAPVYADTEYRIMDRNNMLSVTLSYNFSFGRNRNRAQPQYDNGDDDSGILRK